ncbi:MAG: hypothetical protein Q8M08_01080 [Bacteroidales bacterium]|nr:hypothetical protein [Bacteroidales bacterium]
MKFFYFRQSSGLLFRTTYAIDSTKADILVFGSSRANHHYVPEIFEDSLNGTFYNTGRDGNFILYNYAIFKTIIQRYQPKLIIMDINPEELEFNANTYERLSSLLPYSRDHKEIRSITALRSPWEKIKLFSSVYPYNSLLLTIAVGNLEYNRNRKPDIKGYVPVFRKMKNEKVDTIQVEYGFPDRNKINALSQIINICKQQKIQLLFVRSPVYSIIHDKYFNNIISDLCSEYKVNYFDLSNQEIFITSPAWYVDRNHLNDEGARVFSNLVVNCIKGTGS